MINGEEPPITSFLMLPHDLVLNCLARVSRFQYPTLSLVSKRFRSLLASADLYQTRKHLGRTESCLYACLRLDAGSKLIHWFILCHRPNSSRKVLVPISCPNSTTSYSNPSVVAVGPYIYAIGGGSKNKESSSVMVMDTRSHTWHEAPSMRVARMCPSACTLDGKIYVMGGCDNLDSMNCMEIFDTKTQTWEFLEIPSEEICGGSEYRSISYERTIYMRSTKKSATYKLHKGRWREADICMNIGWRSSSCVVIENVLYCYNYKVINWYDLKNRVWNHVKGLRSFPLSDLNVKLADHDGKMVITWEEHVGVGKTRVIRCAEIAIEKRQNMEIWGRLEWFGNEWFTTYWPKLGYVHALVATVW